MRHAFAQGAGRIHVEAIDLRQLRALRAVARAGSFHGAASELGCTQSAVSHQIKTLETVVGHQLLERTGARSPALPTPAGRALLRHADAVFDELHRAAHDLGRLGQGTTGTVAIGYFESVGRTLLPRVLGEVARALPEVELRLTESTCDLDAQRLVRSGELDLAFVVLPLREPGLSATPLLADAPVAVLRDDDALALGDAIDVSALRGRSLATFEPSAHQTAVERGLRRGGAEPIAHRTNENAALAGLVATGSAVAVMTRLSAAHAEAQGLRAVGIRGLSPRTVGLARHASRGLSPAATAVHDLVVAATRRP